MTEPVPGTPSVRAPVLEHCGRCGAPTVRCDNACRYECETCGWLLYRNVAAAVIGILELDGCVLLVRRGHEPARGKLDLPGGFADFGETAEQALSRELGEELDLRITEFEYVGSFANVYPYRGVLYDTLDVCFAARLEVPPTRVDGDEITGFELTAPAGIDAGDLAFDSVRRALATRFGHIVASG